MKIWAIGDLHLAQDSQKPMDIFGPQWERHTEKVKEAWEQMITSEDVVLLPGDLSWGMRLSEAEKDLAFLEALPGHKICLKGNHDYWWKSLKKLESKGYQTLSFLQNNAVLLGKWGICGTRGWWMAGDESRALEDEKILKREHIRLQLSLDAAIKQGARRLLVMLHYPPTLGGEQQSPFTNLLKKYPVEQVVYGHLHDKASWQQALKGLHEGITYHLVAADYLNFKPLCIVSDEITKDKERNSHEITSCI